jgi:hypothetical protein
MTMLRYNTGKAPLSLIPSSFFEAIFNRAFEYGQPVPTKLIWQVGQVLDFGAQKYSEHNWRKGGKWSSVLNSALRHLVWMVDGRRIDPESNLAEAGHLGCNIAFLLEFAHTSSGEDDRYSVLECAFDAEPEPSLSWVLDALLRFRDGGSIDDLREAAWELARWVEAQDPEPQPAAQQAPASSNDNFVLLSQDKPVLNASLH